MATSQQIITFKLKIDATWKIDNKGWFAWRLETNEKMITNVEVEFECWTCSQHEEMNDKKHNNESTQQVTMSRLEWFWRH